MNPRLLHALRRNRIALRVWLVLIASTTAHADSEAIWVAPFVETSRDVTPELVPRIEARLAARIAAQAGGQGTASFDVTRFEKVSREADAIRARAADEGVEYILMGRWRREEGESRSRLGIELRSGHSGATAYRYALHVDTEGATPADVEAEVSRVVLEMIDDLGWAEAPASVAAGPEQAPTRKGARTDFLRVERDAPIEINSEDLELRAIGDTKHLIFRRDVTVVQGELVMVAGTLEAFYPDGASQPDRLDARDAVRVREGDLEVRCREATYLRDEERVICRGDALLVQGCDEVRGREIEFHIDEERVEVKGAASVVLHLEEEREGACRRGGAG